MIWKTCIGKDTDIKVYCDTYLGAVYAKTILEDIFTHGVGSDVVIIDRAFQNYQEMLVNSKNLYKITLSKGPRRCMWVKGKSKIHVCQVAYFMDMYYYNENESERQTETDMKTPITSMKPYSYKDLKNKNDKALMIRKIQHALANSINSEEFMKIIQDKL